MISCLSIKLACYSDPITYPIGYVVKKLHEEIYSCKIVYANPLPCIVSSTTIIDVINRCDLTIEELKTNILLKLDYSGYIDYLIYPKKTWEKIHTRYLEPLLSEYPPREPGGLLHGPPGTGKTSIIDAIADVVGLYVVQILSGEVLSPYIGESEEKFKNKLDDAETHEPSIVKLDDAEWLLSRRRGLVGHGGAEVFTSASMMQILLDRLPKWKRERKIIVALAATNVNPETLDPALIRSGRFGREPIFVPLPNYEAVYTLMEKMGVMKYISYEKMDEYAKKLVNLGLNMADVRDIIEQIIVSKGTKEPSIEDKKSRGYSRPIPRKIYSSRELFSILDRLITDEILKSKTTRLYVKLPTSIAEALLVQYFTNKGIPIILLEDERYVDEAILTAETTNAILLVNAELIYDDSFKIVHQTTRSPVIYMGEKTSSRLLSSIPIRTVLTTGDLSTALLMKEVYRLVFAYYNVKLPDTEIDKIIARNTPAKLLEKIESIKEWGVDVDLTKLDISRLF